jgi:RHS repeat-associated protein
MGATPSNPLNQYLWHPYYTDALAVRWYDSDTDGSGIADYYYLQDANFNVTAIANSSGAVVERGQYQAYGRVRILNGDSDPDGSPWGIDPGEVSDVGNTHWFTGRELDAETGLQLNRKRFYVAHLGRWLTRDTIEYRARQFNLYAYVGNKPVIDVDPQGTISLPGQCATVSVRCDAVFYNPANNCMMGGTCFYRCTCCSVLMRAELVRAQMQQVAPGCCKVGCIASMVPQPPGLIGDPTPIGKVAGEIAVSACMIAAFQAWAIGMHDLVVCWCGVAPPPIRP